MKSGFVELVVKNRMAGKAIPLGSLQKKYQPVDSFKKYMTSILPKIQQTVQIELLKKNLRKLQSPLIRRQLIASYLRRLYRLRFYEQDQIKSYKQLPEVEPEDIVTIIDPTILKSINEHTYYDVGSYIIFSNEDYKTVFPSKPFGIFDREFEVTEKFSIMIRKEAIGITNVMKLIQNPEAIDWNQIYQLSPEDRIQYINNEQRYPVLFQQLSNYIYDKAKHTKDQQKFIRIWGSSVICDTLVNSILQNIDKIDDVFEMADQCFQLVTNLEVDPSASDFTKRYKELKTSPPIKVYKEMPYFASFNYKTPSCKSVFLGGLAGTGRSMIMAYLAMFAFKNNWIVIHTPNILKWTQDLTVTPQKMFNGLFIIEEHVVEWLEDFKKCNQHILKNINVKKELYGKIDLTGTHQEQYSPVPNIYYHDRLTYFEDITKEFQERAEVEFDTRYKWRLTDVQSEPKTVLDIIEAGLKNPTYSTCAMAQALQQIYQSQHPIAQLIDDYSWLYRRTVYKYFKYYNDSQLFGAIPPYHLAHCRLFVNLDGHKLKRGIKVVASSIGTLYKHHFDIKKIMLPVQYEHRVPNLTTYEFLKATRYNILTGYWQADEVQRKNPLYMYTLCQGNWIDFIKTAQLGHYY